MNIVVADSFDDGFFEESASDMPGVDDSYNVYDQQDSKRPPIPNPEPETEPQFGSYSSDDFIIEDDNGGAAKNTVYETPDFSEPKRSSNREPTNDSASDGFTESPGSDNAGGSQTFHTDFGDDPPPGMPKRQYERAKAQWKSQQAGKVDMGAGLDGVDMSAGKDGQPGIGDDTPKVDPGKVPGGWNKGAPPNWSEGMPPGGYGEPLATLELNPEDLRGGKKLSFGGNGMQIGGFGGPGGMPMGGPGGMPMGGPGGMPMGGPGGMGMAPPMSEEQRAAEMETTKLYVCI